MAASGKYVGLLEVLIALAVHCSDGEILQDPSSQVVLPNDMATFTCIVQTSGDYYIYINGIPTLPDDVPGITIAISDQQNDVHVVSIVIAAQLSANSTTVQCVVDTDSGEGSSVAYLLIAAPPLPPYPVLSQLSATTLYLSWMEPFTLTPVADILYYTVRVFNTVDHKWKLWNVPASPNTSSCHQVDIDILEDTVNNCDELHNNRSISPGLQMLFVQKILSDRNCDKFIIYVSASNVLGESERAGVEGMFPIAPAWSSGGTVLEVKMYLHQNGNRSLLLAVQPPCICPLQRAVYYLMKNNDSRLVLVCNGSHPTLIDVSRELAVEDSDVLTLLVDTLVGNATTSVTINFKKTNTIGDASCSRTPIIITSSMGALTCCAALLCIMYSNVTYKLRSRQAVTPSVHLEQCNQFYDETERNIYDQVEIYKGTTCYPAPADAHK